MTTNLRFNKSKCLFYGLCGRIKLQHFFLNVSLSSYLLVCCMHCDFSLFILCVTSSVIGFMNAPKSTINVNFCVTEMLCFAEILLASRPKETRHVSSINFMLRQMDRSHLCES